MSNDVRIIADGLLQDNDTWHTQINNNDLIIGASGAGKTRYYVLPNLLQCALNSDNKFESSLIVTDTKGNLYRKAGPLLEKHGYKVINLDFINIANNIVGYNPLDFVSYDKKRGCYSEQDIAMIANVMVPIEDEKEPFWETSAQQFLCAFIGYIMELLPIKAHTLEAASYLYQVANIDIRVPSNDGKRHDRMKLGTFLFRELAKLKPNNFASTLYNMLMKMEGADRAYASVMMFLTKNLAPLSFSDVIRLYSLSERIDFAKIGNEKTAVFLNISDNDDSMYKLANVFYTQALQQLIREADNSPNSHLRVPVRLILDDFAANINIPDFDKIISIIRSREISVSIIIQSINQLDAMYGEAKAKTIISNCDHLLYLGGQELTTCEYLAKMANAPLNGVLQMSLDKAWLFVRGQEPENVMKYKLAEHPLYSELRSGDEQYLNDELFMKKADEEQIIPGENIAGLVSYIKLLQDGDIEGALKLSEKIALESGSQPVDEPEFIEPSFGKNNASFVSYSEETNEPISGDEAVWNRRQTLLNEFRDIRRLLGNWDISIHNIIFKNDIYNESELRRLAQVMTHGASKGAALFDDGLYFSFYYCALWLLAIGPDIFLRLNGTLADIIYMSYEVQNIDKYDLFGMGLYDHDFVKLRTGGEDVYLKNDYSNMAFFYYMDELYRILSGISATTLISHTDCIETGALYSQLKAEPVPGWSYNSTPKWYDIEGLHYDCLNTDPRVKQNPDYGPTTVNSKYGPISVSENIVAIGELPEGVEVFAESFPQKEFLCSQYELLRSRLFEKDNRIDFVKNTFNALDAATAYLGVSNYLDAGKFEGIAQKLLSILKDMGRSGL